MVENSLDAGATSIEVALKKYGEESFQVIDNDCGISQDNFKALALKHHTSKLADFSDLQSVTTFGFRGEALSALCYLGDLTVETRTKSEQVATHLSFGRSGLLTDERKTAPPSWYHCNCQEVVLQLACEKQRISPQHSEGVWKVDLSTECLCSDCKRGSSGNGSGRNIIINGRPVDMLKVSKLVNELYRCANSIAIMNFVVPTKEYDVNVTPEKRKVFFSFEVLKRSFSEELFPTSC
ncbi:hypothetical protein L2E82_00047 [Cichorium intybus]|uniref:Uncharacterized protein n=1 Tax=Cichorium intybus TaxID=13427 RepID=A0ACB9GWV0_CICIN|nr:hypothetical protein L2E82_00047 [Cichorium intybus]